MASRNRWWKVLGVASVAGVVATGAIIARDERQRRSYTPEQVRDRLRARVDGAAPAEGRGDGTEDAGPPA